MILQEHFDRNFFEEDAIKDFGDFLSKIEKKIKLKDWLVYKSSNVYIVYELSKSFCDISFSKKIIINSKLPKVIINNNQLSQDNLKWILNREMKLKLWSQLVNIVLHYKNQLNNDCQGFEFYVKQSLEYLEMGHCKYQKFLQRCKKTFRLCPLFNDITDNRLKYISNSSVHLVLSPY